MGSDRKSTRLNSTKICRSGRIRASLAATTGGHGPEDVIKLLMVGADVTMLCSALLRNGVRSEEHTSELHEDLQVWPNPGQPGGDHWCARPRRRNQAAHGRR